MKKQKVVNKNTDKNGIKRIKELPNEKDFTFKGKLVFKAKNKKQEKAMRLMEEKTITFLTGSWGSGKTFLAVFYALKNLLEDNISKIILLRPIAVEEEEYMGYLSGDMSQKIEPFMLPYLDEMSELIGKANVENLIEKEKIVPYSLAYLRGRNFKNTVVILDEVQNASPKALKTVLSRICDQSKVIVMGDKNQKDLPIDKKSAIDIIHYFSKSENMGIIDFIEKDVVRSEISKEILNIFTKMESDDIISKDIVNKPKKLIPNNIDDIEVYTTSRDY